MRSNDFLPGTLALSRGRPSDYALLEAFHYRRGRPATWTDVWVVRFAPHCAAGNPLIQPDGRIVAIGVLSYPPAMSRPRQRHFQLGGMSYGQQIRFANANLRTISRVIVHPQFRALGLSKMLVRRLCDHCPTRYVEASAMMGRAHPFFERAGMTRVEPADQHEPVYYVLDRWQAATAPGASPSAQTPA